MKINTVQGRYNRLIIISALNHEGKFVEVDLCYLHPDHYTGTRKLQQEDTEVVDSPASGLRGTASCNKSQTIQSKPTLEYQYGIHFYQEYQEATFSISLKAHLRPMTYSVSYDNIVQVVNAIKI